VHILLVDDEAELVETLAERLELRGIDTDYALDGGKALSLVQEKAYDVVIVDMKMPGASGIDVMHSLNRARPGMKFIFMTGHGSEQDRDAGCEAGACDYLMKPVQLDLLLERVKAALQL